MTLSPSFASSDALTSPMLSSSFDEIVRRLDLSIGFGSYLAALRVDRVVLRTPKL